MQISIHKIIETSVNIVLIRRDIKNLEEWTTLNNLDQKSGEETLK